MAIYRYRYGYSQLLSILNTYRQHATLVLSRQSEESVLEYCNTGIAWTCTRVVHVYYSSIIFKYSRYSSITPVIRVFHFVLEGEWVWPQTIIYGQHTGMLQQRSIAILQWSAVERGKKKKNQPISLDCAVQARVQGPIFIHPWSKN